MQVYEELNTILIPFIAALVHIRNYRDLYFHPYDVDLISTLQCSSWTKVIRARREIYRTCKSADWDDVRVCRAKWKVKVEVGMWNRSTTAKDLYAAIYLQPGTRYSPSLHNDQYTLHI